MEIQGKDIDCQELVPPSLFKPSEIGQYKVTSQITNAEN